MTRIRGGDLGPLPVVLGLVVIWTVFQLLNPVFLSSENLVNLTMQCAAIGTIALGIVLVLLVGEIDLSVGSVSGLAAAVLAVSFVAAAVEPRPGAGWPRSSSAASSGCCTAFSSRVSGCRASSSRSPVCSASSDCSCGCSARPGSISHPVRLVDRAVRAADVPARRGRRTSWRVLAAAALRLVARCAARDGAPRRTWSVRATREIAVRSAVLLAFLLVADVVPEPLARRRRHVPVLPRASSSS